MAHSEPISAPLRSLLFCPATNARAVAKLSSLGADAVAIDLEDAVPDEHKTAARAFAHTALDNLSGVRTYVRVNPLSTGRTHDDVAAVLHANLNGVVLPKADSAAGVRTVADWLTEAEAAAGLPHGAVTIMPLIETAQGVHSAVDILSADSRVETAIFGYVDFMLDVGIDLIDTTASSEELLFARSSVVVAARVARKRSPLDGPFIGVTADSDDAFIEQCRQGRRLGFNGKMLIHPRHVELAHRGFRPPAEEVAAAQRVIDAFAEAERAGKAAIVVDGRLVDYPVAHRARKIVQASHV